MGRTRACLQLASAVEADGFVWPENEDGTADREMPPLGRRDPEEGWVWLSESDSEEWSDLGDGPGPDAPDPWTEVPDTQSDREPADLAGRLRREDPLSMGWPVGHAVALEYPERDSAPDRQKPGTDDEPGLDWVRLPVMSVSAGKAADPMTEYTFEGRFPAQEGGLPRPGAESFSYTVISQRGIVLPDGLELPADGWVRHGADFLHPVEGAVLLGDSGWIGRVADMNGLALDDLGETELPPYEVLVASGALHLAPVDDVEGWAVRIGPLRTTEATEEPARRAPDIATVGERSGGARRQAIPFANLDDDPFSSRTAGTPPADRRDQPDATRPVPGDGTREPAIAGFSGPQVDPPQTPPAPAADQPAEVVPDQPAEAGPPPGFTLGAVPAGVDWALARRVHSWGLRFAPAGVESSPAAALDAGAGSFYAAVLDASGGSITVEGRVLRDPVELRDLLGKRMRDKPPAEGLAQWPQAVESYVSAVRARVAQSEDGASLPAGQIDAYAGAQIGNGQAWEQVLASVTGLGYWSDLESRVVPQLFSEYLGSGLLVLEPGGQLNAYGSGGSSGPVLVVARSVGSDGASRWAGVPSVVDGPALGGLSPAQVGWATGAGMVFIEPRDGDGLLDALVAAGRAAQLAAPYDDPQALRRELVRRMYNDRELVGSGDWALISEEYVRRAVGAAGDGRPATASEAEESARERLADGQAYQEIIAGVAASGGDAGLTGVVLPLMVRRYLKVQVVEPHDVPSAQAPVSFPADADGPVLTVARIAGGDGDSWVGMAPVTAPWGRGAGTRPADVAGGWREPAPVQGLTDASGPAASAPQHSYQPGRVPVGMTAAQRDWALRHRRKFAEVPVGADGFFHAVLQAADGGFSTDDAFVSDAGHLRELLADKIRQTADTDLGLWLTVHTIYVRRLAERQGQEPGQVPEDVQVPAQEVNGDRMLADVITSATDPDSWPELAEDVAPFFLSRLGLAVRVIDASGEENRYGRGRPVYVTPVAGAGEGQRRWVALPRTVTRFGVGSPLATPNLSDPVLVRLGQALDARRADRRTTGVPVDQADPVAEWLRDVREQWAAKGTEPQATMADTPDMPDRAVGWDPAWLADTVAGLVEATGLGGGPMPGDGDGAVGLGVSLGLAVQLAQALFPAGRDIRPEQAEGAAAGQAGPLAGIPADQWVVAPSLRDLIGAVPVGGAALFLDGARAWMVVETTGGLRRLVSFDPDEPTTGRVTIPPPGETPAIDSPVNGLALVIGPNGTTVPAERLDGSFAPATGWDGAALGEAFAGGGPRRNDPAGTIPGVSERQYAWAREHQATLIGTRPGPNSFFDAVITAAGGRLTVNGQEVTDAAGLRQWLAAHVREKAASDGLGRWPLTRAAFVFGTEERTVEEYLGDDPSQLDRVRSALQRQTAKHFDTGAAAEFIEQAMARPGHWEQLAQLVAPDLLADLAGVDLLVLGPDGRIRGHGATDGPAERRLVVASSVFRRTGLPDWVAVVPETTGPDSRPFGDVTIDSTTVDGTSGLADKVPALLSSIQQQIVEEEQLRVEPTEVGTHSIYSAVLDANGGGVFFDRDTFIDDPAQLRQALARMVRERPDLLDATTLRRISQLADEDGLDIEKIIDSLADPADHDSDRFARHLIGPYLGIEVRVIEADGATEIHGTGQPVTIAPTSDERGGTQWAALVPGEPDLLHAAPPPGLPGLPGILQPPANHRWNPFDYRVLQPGVVEPEEEWRDSSFCIANEQGVTTCVSVAVITLDRPIAAST